MACSRSALVLGASLSLGCQAATGGLGGRGDSSTTMTDTSTGAESGDTSAGDGDGQDGDGDGDPSADTDTDSGDGDGDGDPPCGNGTVDNGEDCDGFDLGGRDCVSLGFESGVLSCDESCVFDTSACVSSLCGNGVIDPGEDCDGVEVGGLNCLDLGEGPGIPLCTETCVFDTSTCGIAGEGESCGFLDECPSPNLYCAEGKCWDGSLGDPCNAGPQCISNNCSGLINGECVP